MPRAIAGVRIAVLRFSHAVEPCAVQLSCSAQALAHDLAELAGFEHVGVVAQLALQG